MTQQKQCTCFLFLNRVWYLEKRVKKDLSQGGSILFVSCGGKIHVASFDLTSVTVFFQIHPPPLRKLIKQTSLYDIWDRWWGGGGGEAGGESKVSSLLEVILWVIIFPNFIYDQPVLLTSMFVSMI